MSETNNSMRKHKTDSGDSSNAMAKKKPRTEVEVSSIPDGNPLASLPLDVSFVILDKLFESKDHLSFAGVCKSWCSISRNYNNETRRWHKKGNMLPLFLVSTESEQKGKTRTHELEAYDVSSGDRCKDTIYFPVSHGTKCCGSSHGWLGVFDMDREGKCFSITLVHPFQKSVEPIKLPRLDFMTKQWQEYVRKVILSSDPILNPDSYVVVVLYNGCGGSKMAFIKAGQRKWTYTDRRRTALKDVIFYRNQVYTVVGGSDGKERVMSFDVHSCNNPAKPPKAINRTPNGVPKIGDDYSNLVESVEGDHLWCVRRLISLRTTAKHSERFRVFKLVFDEKDGSVVEQVEVHSIGDEALFVGGTDSISVLASSFPGVNPNSIYYTTEEPYNFDYPDQETYHICSLDDATIKEHDWTCRHFFSPIPCGVWILPKFKGLF